MSIWEQKYGYMACQNLRIQELQKAKSIQTLAIGVIIARKDKTIVVAGNLYTNRMVKSQAEDNYHFGPKFEEIGFNENEDFPKLKAIIRKVRLFYH